MSAALRTLVDLAARGGRPVAVLGDMLELGAFEAEAHRALGEEAARAGVRVLAAFGPRVRAAAEAARAAGGRRVRDRGHGRARRLGEGDAPAHRRPPREGQPRHEARTTGRGPALTANSCSTTSSIPSRPASASSTCSATRPSGSWRRGWSRCSSGSCSDRSSSSGCACFSTAHPTCARTRPTAHKKKAGTPSMGGALILLAVTVSTLLFADLANRYVWAALLVTLGFGAIGFWDDWLKISKRNSKGLAGKQEAPVAGAVGARGLLRRPHRLELPPRAGVPVAPGGELRRPPPHAPLRPDAASSSRTWAGSTCRSCSLVIVGTSHAVNLTDGLDGLAIGPTIVSSMAFLALSYVAERHHRRVQPRRVPAHRLHPGGRGAGRLLLGHLRRGRRVPLVQHVSCVGVHGRRRLARARRRPRHARRPHQERGGERDPARRVPRARR